MRGRVIGLGLLGLGAFLLAAAVALPAVLVPSMVRLPLDQKADVVVTDPHGTYLDLSKLAETQGPVTAHLLVQGDPTARSASTDVAVWHSGTTITDSKRELIVEPSEVVNCLDRRTAAAVACDEASQKIDGLTLTFPFGTQKRDYPVWNGNVGKAVTARFAGEDSVDGVDVYRFQQSVPETVIKKTDVPAHLAGGTGDAMVPAEAVYSSERTILVEPVSGKIVSSVEKPVIVLRGPDGVQGAHVLEATLGPDDAALKKAAADAADTRGQIRFIGTVLPWAVAVLGLVLLVVGLLLFLRARRLGAHSPQHADASPVPVAAS
jgi:Porin PorA